MKALNEYINKITAITKRTELGEISWQKGSQTTFSWRTTGINDENAVISVQKSRSRIRLGGIVKDRIVYIFQIVLQPKETLVNLSSIEYTNTPLPDVLERLYNAAEYSADKRSIDLFDSILKKNKF